jgi:hypothetical protein
VTVRRTRTRSEARADVVDLSVVRERMRLVTYQERVSREVDANRQAFSRLYHSGALFSSEGTRIGRDLLRVHQILMRLVSLVNQLSDTGDLPAPRTRAGAEAVYLELDGLLERTAALTQKTGHLLARLQGE